MVAPAFAHAIPCVGITVTPPLPKSRTVADFPMMHIPGSFYPKGSVRFMDKPRWVSVDSFLLGKQVVSGGQFRKKMKDVAPRVDSSPMFPAISLSHHAKEFLLRLGEGRLRFPSDDEYELAARGPAVNIPQLMKKELGEYNPVDVEDFVENRFENFVIPETDRNREPVVSVLTSIYPHARNQEFQRRIRTRPDLVFYGWRRFGTNSGFLIPEEAWLQNEGPPLPIWGEENAFGIKGMAGGVRVWVTKVHASRLDNVTEEMMCIRGASYMYRDEKSMLAAKRWDLAASSDEGDDIDGLRDVGIRPAANFP